MVQQGKASCPQITTTYPRVRRIVGAPCFYPHPVSIPCRVGACPYRPARTIAAVKAEVLARVHHRHCEAQGAVAISWTVVGTSD